MEKYTKNKYLLFVLIFNELFFLIICSPPPLPKDLPKPKNKIFYENLDDRQPRNEDDKFDIERKYDELLKKEEETKTKYDELYLETQKQKSQLEVDKVTMFLLFIIIGFLLAILLGFVIYEIIKHFKNKNQKNDLLNLLVNDMKERSSFSTSVDSNSTKSNQNKKNEENSENFPSENEYEDEDNAPVLLVENNHKEPEYDEFKTLTNDEDIYFASRTDKILYRPYPKNEI